jgi:hypothetical protein
VPSANLEPTQPPDPTPDPTPAPAPAPSPDPLPRPDIRPPVRVVELPPNQPSPYGIPVDPPGIP